MRILITGDSWGCGEWDGLNVDYRVTHAGIEQYLRDDGYDVENISIGGNNNLMSYHLINDNVFDQRMYVGRIQFNLNDGKKRRFLYFQADYIFKR